MLKALLEFSRSSSLAIALLGAHFVIYAVVAWIVLIARAGARQMKRKELILLGAWLGLLVVELIQVTYHRGNLTEGETWGIPRYFGIFAPLLWIWLAWLCAKLWSFHSSPSPSPPPPPLLFTSRALLIAALVWLFCAYEYTELKGAYEGLVRKDVSLAAEKAARLIRKDYAGPKKQETVKRYGDEYFSDARPVVFSDFGYLAWILRGQSEGPITGSGVCPYPDDYLFLRVGSGYGGRKTIDAKEYDFVTSFFNEFPDGKGRRLKTEWRLFRRKTTPHN